MKDLERLPSFWDFVNLTPNIVDWLRFVGGYLPTIRIHSKEGRMRLTLRHTECHHNPYGRTYGKGYDAWEYTYYVRNIFGYEMVYSMGYIVLDCREKTMVEQTILEGYSVHFQNIASLFFVDAAIYTYLPTLKSISIDTMKTHNIRNFHNIDSIHSLD